MHKASSSLVFSCTGRRSWGGFSLMLSRAPLWTSRQHYPSDERRLRRPPARKRGQPIGNALAAVVVSLVVAACLSQTRGPEDPLLMSLIGTTLVFPQDASIPVVAPPIVKPSFIAPSEHREHQALAWMACAAVDLLSKFVPWCSLYNNQAYISHPITIIRIHLQFSSEAATMEEPRSPSSAPDRSLLAMMDEAQHRLQHLEISCRQILSPPSAPSPQRSQPDDPELLKLKLQVTHLQTQLLAAVTRREEDDIAFRHAARFETAKGVANGVLHALFDQASLGKVAVLRDYLDSGSIPTRDGLRHWRLDLRSVRNEAGASLMHVAVGVSTARERVKVKLVQLLLDRAKFDPNVPDVVW
jgi:hypothetical protein